MARRKAKSTGKRKKASGRAAVKKKSTKTAGTGRARGAGRKSGTRPGEAKRAGGAKRRAPANRAPAEMKDEEPSAVREVSLGSLEAAEEESESSESQRARRQADAMAGDEEPGGTVEVPDHDSVDEWAAALGVERSPESPVRSSADVLDDRDRRRGGSHPPPKL
jgi:hypothetical protein